MIIEDIIWLDSIVEKLAIKHRVETCEVEEVLYNNPKFRFVEKGDHEGEDVYMVLGQTDGGRYLIVLFIYKVNRDALVLSARDMADKERRLYERK